MLRSSLLACTAELVYDRSVYSGATREEARNQMTGKSDEKEVIVSRRVTDGYASARRPQMPELDLSLFESDMTDAQIEDEIDRQVLEDFEDRVSFDYESSIRKAVEEIRAIVSPEGNNEE